MLELLTTIEFQMSLLLFVALGGYLLASRLNQSAVIGEILLGLYIGPSFLGLITYTEFVSGLAHLGAIILLFVVGLEFRLSDIVNKKYAVIALFGVIIPWVAGYYTALFFGYNFASAVFIGTALTATSIAITAHVLKEMNKLQTDAAKAIIGAAVIDDVLALLALSATEQVVAGTLSLSSTLLVVAKAGSFLVIGLLIGRTFISDAVKKIDKSRTAKKHPEFAFIFAIMVAFLYAAMAELVGLSAIVGSFIAGVSLGGIVLKYSKDYHEGAEYLHIIFASIFFVSLGILVEISALTLEIIVFLIAITIVAIITKVIGCGIIAKLQGMKGKDALIVGFGMTPRGEVAMIVALIGLNEGIIGQDIFISIVLMSLLTTILAPVLLRNWLYKKGG